MKFVASIPHEVQSIVGYLCTTGNLGGAMSHEVNRADTDCGQRCTLLAGFHEVKITANRMARPVNLRDLSALIASCPCNP
jgi:hypothetical protein